MGALPFFSLSLSLPNPRLFNAFFYFAPSPSHMAIVTGDRYLEKLVSFIDRQAGPLLEGSIVLKLNPVGLHYVQSRLEALRELERLLAGAPVDYLRAYVSDLGDHRALEQLRRILRLLTSLKVVSILPPPARDPTRISLLPFGRLKVLELRGCDLSTSDAKGLLELRHTLEKIICHNSTNALRHVFASRIAEIKESPQWNRLGFVSCACNRLILMDESLQLLPAVETLDLSRNKFAKIDNLRKCTKLKHLDLGFNHLRSITGFSEVSCHIVKLVLRNNALTSLHGIENLKSLEDLDVSYNVISNFTELEFLTGLSSLQRLWLEGNPLCCSRWYRAQVYSYFTYPEKLKLDDKEISTREFWKRQIIIASRLKRPAAFGFYSPAKGDADGEGNDNRKRKKVSRLAAIESEEESTYVGSDQGSISCDNEIQNKEETPMSDDEIEIVDLMNKVEHMKKERSVLWLRELKEWMDHSSGNLLDASTLNSRKEDHLKNKKSQRHFAESSKYVSDSVHASGDASSTNVLESDNSFVDMPMGLHTHQYFDHIGSLGITGEVSLTGMGRMDLRQEHHKPSLHEGVGTVSKQSKSSYPDIFTIQGHRMVENVSGSPLTSIDDITDAHSSSACPGSPPHYQVDILHRRHNLVEEILQLSADSYSLASSDSNTSCSDDDSCIDGPSMPEVDQSLNHEDVYRTDKGHSSSNLFKGHDCGHLNDIDHVRENGVINNSSVGPNDDEVAHSVNQEADWLERKKRKKHRKRVISLFEEQTMVGEVEESQKSNGNLDTSGAGFENEQGKQIFAWSDLQKATYQKQTQEIAISTPSIDNSGRSSVAKCSYLMGDDFVEDFFNKNIADSRSHETCRQYMFCCMLEQDSMYREREVAIISSSKNKLYVLLFGVSFDGSATTLSLLGCHKIEDVREVLFGLGLQVVRVSTETGAAYLFVTRSIEKSRQLLSTLQVLDLVPTNDKCSLRSLEQVQVELFEKHICGGSQVSIFQYSMLLFWCSANEEGLWLARSLFLIGGHMLVCSEDLMQFGSFSVDASFPPYYSLHLCCSVDAVSEMVIEASESCVTLAVECAASDFCLSATASNEVAAIHKKKTSTSSQIWKLKWFSQESLSNFVALLKAMHAGKKQSPLLVRCMS
ncbi:uncharacterized protein LOC116140486 isoform X1 [Pistacia vera]|uniref:uncharacterized protein LOC116140486 isoform X1 n=1 Tax=Pistacia vera TaxID=55513 RepID=UPI0012633A7A|nr:uncharacterized protein LOC116140486 isoform X1 [Pistacia vera]